MHVALPVLNKISPMGQSDWKRAFSFRMRKPWFWRNEACTIFFFFTILFIYLFMRDTEREAEGGEAGSMQEARRGTRSRESRITPWAKGRRPTTEPPRDPGGVAFDTTPCLSLVQAITLWLFPSIHTEVSHQSHKPCGGRSVWVTPRLSLQTLWG